MGCAYGSNANVTAELEKVIESNERDSPLAYVQELLTDSERRQMLLACGELGEDPSSKYFCKRTKSIGYVVHLHDRWFQLTLDWFIQPSQYNDFSGGFKRQYKLLPTAFIECEATQKMLNHFKAAHKIPSGELVFCQVQTSHIPVTSSTPKGGATITRTQTFNVHANPPNLEEKASELFADILARSNTETISKGDTERSVTPADSLSKHEMSITGQGIHTDGCDVCALACLNRENINGAKNSIYHDLAGKETYLEPFVLQEGKVLHWKDNKIFHYVSPASLVNEEKEGMRTIVLMSYPIIFMVDGVPNPNNTLGRNVQAAGRQLRNNQK